jgi:hypothetical protein
MRSVFLELDFFGESLLVVQLGAQAGHLLRELGSLLRGRRASRLRVRSWKSISIAMSFSMQINIITLWHKTKKKIDKKSIENEKNSQS